MNPNVSFVYEQEFEEALEAFCIEYGVASEDILLGIEWVLARDPYAATEITNDEPISVFVISVSLYPVLSRVALVFFYYEYLAEDEHDQVVIHFEDIRISELDGIF